MSDDRDVRGDPRRIEHQIDVLNFLLGELPTIYRHRKTPAREQGEITARTKAALRTLRWVRDNREELRAKEARGDVAPAPEGTIVQPPDAL
jgi:hypothetical protein